MKYTRRWMVQALSGGGGGSGASISIGVGPGSSQPFACGGSSELGDPVTPWSWGPLATGDGDPLVAPGSSARLGSGDPDPSLAPGSYTGPGS
jgi:hypothetical protein